ncbi:SDR family NAD(P)-dependent oxidoreductase [Robiginitomaculum antarcticum]|uniref:SDR family NAD(P)-dependent oxidoreductase n=1 Tax=Robiginitomaculum antarcticum TaxID=437507 RepID=UPI000378B6DF|nr:SDR family NAD(P)-dependent oxidoreductase [Robiginitomaculum antarcticum]
MTDKALAGRVTLVTGASRGIGYFAALALAKAGSHVIALARTSGALEELDDEIKAAGGEATLVPMDLKSPDGLDQLGGIIHQRWGRLDGLLGNAAILGDITPAPHIDPKKWDEVLAVNVTANARLIRSLDPLLRSSKSGRALFMTSSVARSFKPYWGSYAASKAALEALVLSYAGEVEDSTLKVNLFDPLRTRTAMRAKAMPGEDPQILKHPRDISDQIVGMLSPSCVQHGQLVIAQA